MSSPQRHFRLENGPAPGVVVWMDVAGKPVNIFWDEVLLELESLVAQWEQSSDESPIIIRSAKAKGFAAGADLKRIAAFQTADEVEAFLLQGQQVLDRLERLRRPTVAVISGHCLGGGLEFALACRHRVAVEPPVGETEFSPTQLGLPETTLGLIPAWGGTQRLPRLVGLSRGLDLMMSGDRMTATAALQMGLVDHVLPSMDETGLDRWIASLPRNASVAAMPPAATDADEIFESARRRWLGGDGSQPAREAILQAVRAGWPDDMQSGLAAERNEFLRLVFSEGCRARLAAMFSRKPA